MAVTAKTAIISSAGYIPAGGNVDQLTSQEAETLRSLGAIEGQKTPDPKPATEGIDPPRRGRKPKTPTNDEGD